jgi:hypothetical protein
MPVEAGEAPGKEGVRDRPPHPAGQGEPADADPGDQADRGDDEAIVQSQEGGLSEVLPQSTHDGQVAKSALQTDRDGDEE